MIQPSERPVMGFFCGRGLTFLTDPRMPETVRMEAPSNLATCYHQNNFESTKKYYFVVKNVVGFF